MKVEALTKEESSLARKATAAAISSGSAKRPPGQWTSRRCAFTDINFRHPVYVGDTLYAESACTEARRSKSRDYAGIISMTTRGLNQDGVTVVSWKRSVMIATRDSGIGQGHFPEATDSVSDYS